MMAHFKSHAGDDEVDYGIIKQFGRTVGKEKIEKNTPVFEAQTNSDVALKNRMISVANPYLTALPTLAASVTTGGTTLVRGSSPIQADLTITQSNFNNANVDLDLRDPSFLVQYDSRFLSVTGYENNVSTPSTGNNYISTVRVRQTSTNSDGSNGSMATLRVSIKSFSDSYYNFYSTSANSGQIRTFLTITGTASGGLITQQILINKNSSVT